MARNIKLLVYPVKDVEKAKAFYGEFFGCKTIRRRSILRWL
jgi:extradiol dioxygenase family protein